MKKQKYNNTKTIVNDITFASKLEARRYTELKILERGNIISDLQLQVSYVLIPSQKGGIRNELSLKYIADFVYVDVALGKTIVEDVKGFSTPIFIAKRKMMKQMGYEITEIN